MCTCLISLFSQKGVTKNVEKENKKELTKEQEEHFELLRENAKHRGIDVKIIGEKIHYFDEKGELICTEPISVL